MKKLVISAALALVSLTMSAQDIYQFSNASKNPKTFKVEKVSTVQQSQDSLSTTAQQSQDSFSATRRALTLQELTTVNPTIPMRAGAAYLRKSAHLDNLALGLAGASAATAIIGATMDDTDSQKPFWYASGLFALSGLASTIVSIQYKLRASKVFSSVTISPSTIKLAF